MSQTETVFSEQESVTTKLDKAGTFPRNNDESPSRDGSNHTTESNGTSADENDNEAMLKRNADNLSEEEEDRGSKKIKWHEMWEPVEAPPNLSKRQRKKYIRKVLWETKWKPLRRKKEKERLKQRKIEARLNNETLGPSRKMLKHSTMASSKCKLRVTLDFSFDALMTEKDIGKCVKQLSHCYCMNRRATEPLQLNVTNFNGPAQQLLARNDGYQNWDVHFHEKNHLEIFSKEELVYLTSDSDNVLSQLDDTKVYIIGALVDHNKHKGMTLNLAKEQGISHAQLPIADHLQMNSRKVLTIDHVFQILIHVSEGTSWKEALLRVIPQRKGAVEKTSKTDI